MDVLLVAGAALLAFSNGANDNFKGFATVWGSGTLSYRNALAWATVATVAGSLVSVVFADALVHQFSGKGLVPSDVAGQPAFIVSVGLGAAFTVMVATRIGLPVSTTHALIGGLVGAGYVHGEGVVNINQLFGTFLLPLLISPLIAAALGWLVYRVLRLRKPQQDCACVVMASGNLDVGANGSAVVQRVTHMQVLVDTNARCDQISAPMIRARLTTMLDGIHTLSAASICFARGVNDTPKLVALLLAAQAVDAQISALAIAAVMALGGLLFSRRVAHTMSHRIVRMDHTQGVSANLISAALILFASKLGLPVSTTHVSVGSIAGIAVGTQSFDPAMLRNVLLSWVATLPLAALSAWLVASLL